MFYTAQCLSTSEEIASPWAASPVVGLACTIVGKCLPFMVVKSPNLVSSATPFSELQVAPNSHHLMPFRLSLHPWHNFNRNPFIKPKRSHRNYHSSLLYADSGAVVVNKPPGLVCQLGDDGQSKNNSRSGNGDFKELLTGT